MTEFDWRKYPVDNLEVSIRTANGLEWAGIRTLGDLLRPQWSEANLLQIKNFGKRSLRDLREAIEEMGFTLGSDQRTGVSTKRANDLLDRGIRALVDEGHNIRELQLNRAFPGMHIVLVGDIVSGFEAYGPFKTGNDAVRWKQGDEGQRELTQGQWYLMQLKEPT